MGNAKFYKLFGLILIAALIVSSNIAVCTAASGFIGDSQNSLISPSRHLSKTNHAGAIENAAPQSNWTTAATSCYTDSANAVEIVIGIDSDASSYGKIAAALKESGGEVIDTISMGAKTAVVAKVSSFAASSFVTQVQGLGISNYIEPNGKSYVDSTPNDQYWNLQWGPKRVAADYAWNTTVGSDDLLVAVIDTGIDYNHPDLQANYVPLGYDFVNNDNDPLDDYGHGTHCAGIIAATINNTEGIAGIAKVKIMAEKGIGADGSGTDTALAKCIVNATDAGAKILSNSWGGSGSSLYVDAINYATAHGVLVLAAAGNENTDQYSYPAAYENVVAVAATNVSDTRASFSNYGSWIDVAAPGVMIYSTMPTYNVTMNNQPRFTTTYSYANGTSMACPAAAGVAALIWSQYPTMTAQFVRQQLEATCDDVGDPGFDNYFGYGIVNAQRGVEETPTAHDLAAQSWVKPSFVMLGVPQSFNLTVINRGLLNETKVQVSLLLNGTIVDSALIPSLAAYRTATTSLSWTPPAIGSYNVTCYVAPTSGESDFGNNQLSVNYTVVASPISAGWTQIASQIDYDLGTCNVKAVYSQLESDVAFFKVEYYRPWNVASVDLDIGITIDVDQNISTGMPQDYYFAQNNSMGADFLILVGNEGNEMWQWDSAMRQYDYNNPINLLYLDAADNSSAFVVGISADTLQTTGNIDCSLSDLAPFYYLNQWWTLWNWVPGSGYIPFVAQPSQRDLLVTLETPRIWTPQTPLTVAAKVFNFGQTSEANVNLKLYVNGEVVANPSFASIDSGEYQTATYTWTPTTGYYNITAYTKPVAAESDITNNQRSRMLPVSPKIAVIADNNELWRTLSILDSMNINYDYGSNNSGNLYTANITILSSYPTVIYYNAARNITVQEQATLNGYLAAGGNLLVTGPDSLYYPEAKLANVVRVTSSGDDLTSGDLIVVDASHYIMNSGYGSFGAGYQITGLGIDNDAIEADTSRNATTIAELSDGRDKLVATDSLPGKVVFWNGVGTGDWLGNSDCTAILKNMLLWFLDVTPPVTTDDYNGEWWIADFTINLSAKDYFGVNRTYYKINGGATQSVSANGQPLITTEGSNNTLEYWSTDIYGHTETHHFLTQIKLDKMGPTGTLQIMDGSGYVTSTNVTLSLTASDPISGIAQVRYSNDGVWDTEPWEPMSASKAWNLTSGDGNKTVYCALKNNAGIPSIISASTILDTVPPNGSIVINGGANYTNTASVNLTLTLTDINSASASMRFSNDNFTWDSWLAFSTAGSWNLPSGDGDKTVYVQFRDNAGLISPFNSTIILDTTPPTAEAGSSQTITRGGTVILNGGGSQDSSGIVSYSWDFGDGEATTGATASHTYVNVGVYTATLTVMDVAGNTASDIVTITVKAPASSSSSSGSTSTPTQTPKPSATPTPTPTPTTIQATNDSGANVTLTIEGDIAASQISDVTLHVDQAAGTTTLSFTVTGENSTTATGTLTIPKSQVLYGTEPIIYIDGVADENQSYTQDADNYYVTYTVHFSTHDISVVFSGVVTEQEAPDYTLLIVGVVLAAVVCVAAAVLLLRCRGKA